jgi:hypothetical protein
MKYASSSKKVTVGEKNYTVDEHFVALAITLGHPHNATQPGALADAEKPRG